MKFLSVILVGYMSSQLLFIVIDTGYRKKKYIYIHTKVCMKLNFLLFRIIIPYYFSARSMANGQRF